MVTKKSSRKTIAKKKSTIKKPTRSIASKAEIDEKMKSINGFMKKMNKFKSKLNPQEKQYMTTLCAALRMSLRRNSLDGVFNTNDAIMQEIKSRIRAESRKNVAGTPVTAASVTLLSGNSKLR
ncbi:hypothetical protein [Nitrosarchaeum sp. AC2]|uniref:hypothetical protein n=1 Tax=Nitrosarchaeum sp. AC2 TaxID=2259673 RepID=UPI0015C8E0E5|nr:hypothetical protein [Nitrosarchaeum sp. AC2]QLH11273.1 hypothetical protein DSQ20_07215 [Nitrosarchaeum sp. AC2]